MWITNEDFKDLMAIATAVSKINPINSLYCVCPLCKSNNLAKDETHTDDCPVLLARKLVQSKKRCCTQC